MPFQFTHDGKLDDAEIAYLRLQAKKLEAITETLLCLVGAIYLYTIIVFVVAFTLGYGVHHGR